MTDIHCRKCHVKIGWFESNVQGRITIVCRECGSTNPVGDKLAALETRLEKSLHLGFTNP